MWVLCIYFKYDCLSVSLSIHTHTHIHHFMNIHNLLLNLIFPKKCMIYWYYYFNPSNTNSFTINILRIFSLPGEVKLQLRAAQALLSDCLPWGLSWRTHRTPERHALNRCATEIAEDTGAELIVKFNSDHTTLNLLLHNALMSQKQALQNNTETIMANTLVRLTFEQIHHVLPCSSSEQHSDPHIYTSHFKLICFFNLVTTPSRWLVWVSGTHLLLQILSFWRYEWRHQCPGISRGEPWTLKKTHFF